MKVEEVLDNPEIQKYVQQQVEAKAKAAVEEATHGLLNKRDELLAEKKKIKSELDEIKSKYNFEELDEIREKYKKAQEEKLTVEERLALREQELLNNFSKREKELLTKSEQEINNIKSVESKKDAALRKYLVDAELSKEITRAGGVIELLLPILRDKIKVVEDGDEYSAKVFEGNLQRVGDSKGNPMTIAQLVEEYKANPVYGVAFKSSGATGGDAAGNTKDKASGPTVDRKSMSVRDKIAYIDKHGLEAFEKLK